MNRKRATRNHQQSKKNGTTEAIEMGIETDGGTRRARKKTVVLRKRETIGASARIKLRPGRAR
jgi:hypothetical protein